MHKKRNKVISVILLFGDFFVFYGALYVALFVRSVGNVDYSLFLRLQEPFLFLFFFWVVILFVIDFYELLSFRKVVVFLRGIFVFLVFAVLIGSVYFYFQPELIITPRTVLFLTALFFAIFSSVWRYIVLRIFGSKLMRKRVFMVGFCKEMEDVLSEKMIDYEVVGIYTSKNVPQKIKEKFFITSKIKELNRVAKKVEILIFAPHVKNDSQIVKKIFATFPLNVRYVEFFSFYEEIKRKIPLYSVNEWWFLENISRPEKRIGEFSVRLLEIFTSFIGLCFLFLLFPMITFFIKINSRGPVLYRQERIGKNGESFVLYKFRTLIDRDRDDPWRESKEGEITFVGKILRKIHLDELPQLYNIFRGDLSFVGPRPEMVELNNSFKRKIPFYNLRYLVRPGLTGWAQINYPPSKTVKQAEEKFKYDLYYIKNRSLFFDFVIILKTVRTIF